MLNEFIVRFRPFDKVECCFDIVAVYGNNVAGFGINAERNFVLSTKSKQIKHVQFVSTLSKGRNFVRRSAMLPKPTTLLSKNGNNVEATFDYVETIVRLVAQDVVAGVDWT